MAILSPTGLSGTIVWMGRVEDRDAALASSEMGQAEVGYDGLPGESHGGLTRKSCARVLQQYPRGTEIRNVRQITILSEEDMAATARDMGLDRLEPEWVGASLIIKGIPDFTMIPPSSRLISQSGLGLVVDMENAPCTLSARSIEQFAPGYGKLYKQAAQNRRGVTAWVERPGPLHIGDVLQLHAPPNRIYRHIPTS